MRALLIAVLATVAVLGVAGAAGAVTYAFTVKTDASSYTGPATVTVSGQVTPAPGPYTSVAIRVFNPTGTLVTALDASVNGTTGLYSATFVLGGSPVWIVGTYTINATWGAYGPVISSVTTFSWYSSSTTSLTTSQTSTATISSGTVTSSSSMSSSSMSSSSTSTSSFSTSSSTTSTISSASTTSVSSSSSTSSGSVPEFPFQIAGPVLLSLFILASYILIGRRSKLTRS